MNLQLSLKTKWFEMTKPLIKKEDYRAITPYWAKRFLECHGNKLTKELTDLEIESLCEELINAINCFGEIDEEIDFVLDNYYCAFKKFKTNIMTLGYPKSGDTERIIQFEHAGIEIRTGNPEWGAEPDKLYFVILHGSAVE
jgi:hypothetical protein